MVVTINELFGGHFLSRLIASYHRKGDDDIRIDNETECVVQYIVQGVYIAFTVIARAKDLSNTV